MLTRRDFLRVGCAVGGALARVAVPNFDAHAQASNRTVVWGTANNISRLNPQLSSNWPDIYVYENIYDALTRRDTDNKLIPGLATEWKLLNETTWQFKLRPGVKFHNGDPLTAADVKFTIERSYDPAARTLVAGLFNAIQRVDIVDDLTVNIVTKRSDPLQPTRHAVWGNGSIMPAKYFQQVGADAFERRPVGTGPYKVVEWVKDDHLTLAPNKDYWGGPPHAESIVMKPKTEPAARVAALLAGEVNFVDFVPSDQLDRLRTAPNVRIASYTYAGYVAPILNAGKPPLDNKWLRQAMSVAIDRPTIVKELQRGQGVVANGFIPQGDFAYNPNRPPLPYNPQSAKDLLKQSGYKGEEILCETLHSDLPLLEALAAMWKSVGISAKVQLIENAVRAQKIREKSYSVLIVYPGSTTGDPDGLMWRTLVAGGLYATWRDPEFDRLGEESRYLLEPEKRRQNYERMQDILLEHFIWIPLYQPVYSYAPHQSIRWKPSPSSTVDFRRENLSFA